MKKYIDARNLPNPQPLVYTKRALADGEFSYLIVHVNNKTAKDNVIRFAEHAGFPVQKTEEREGEYFITIANTEELPSTVEPKPQEDRSPSEENSWPETESQPQGTAGSAGAAGSSGTSETAPEPAAAALHSSAAAEPLRSGMSWPHGGSSVKTILLGTGPAVQARENGRIEVSPFLDRFLRSLATMSSGLQQILLTDGAALLAEEDSEYLPLLIRLQHRGVHIYCDEESCDEWEAAPSPEAVTLIDAESLTEKLLRHGPVLTF
jgi:TusA-related sulfurtransferase